MRRLRPVYSRLWNFMSIDNLQVTYDVLSKYNDGKIPILDLKAGINTEGKIEYTFYRKPMTNNLLTLKSAASSMKHKMAILTQQCFMRLHNTSESIPEITRVAILNEFMQDLYISGYSERDRYNILTAAINTFKKIKQQEFSQIRPFYRPNSFKHTERKHIKSKKKSNWYQGKNYDNNFKSVLFVEATPGDKLTKMIRETEEKFQIAKDQRIKVVSKSGMKLVHLLEQKNPFAKNCENDCPPCENTGDNSNKITNCKVNNVCYEASCNNCKKSGVIRTYTGETARNLHTRSKEHISDMKSNKKSWMKSHIDEEHDGKSDEVSVS